MRLISRLSRSNGVEYKRYWVDEQVENCSCLHVDEGVVPPPGRQPTLNDRRKARSTVYQPFSPTRHGGVRAART